MADLYTYCLSHKNLNFLNPLNINIIGTGNYSKNYDYYPKDWLKDDSGKNISFKNKSFGSLTSHYWLWQNMLDKHKKNDWIAVCHYRRFWVKKDIGAIIEIKDLKKNLLENIPSEDNEYDFFLPKKVFVNKVKFTKLIKKGFRNYLRDPSILFNNKKNNIELHFDMFHGFQFLSKATDVMPLDDRNDFKEYGKSESFYPFQMFISKPDSLNILYQKTFEWIFECEKIFKDYKLEGYGKERLYDFLAERFFSFYFEKYTKIKTIPYKLIKVNLE
tara:strand:- start:102 stop:920 length:819 start_codon:yes stop_codon:yes gene_type:complete